MGMEAADEMVAPLSLTPKLAKGLHELLGEMLGQYEKALGKVA